MLREMAQRVGLCQLTDNAGAPDTEEGVGEVDLGADEIWPRCCWSLNSLALLMIDET